MIICEKVEELETKTLADHLRVAATELEAAGIPDSRREASGLLEFAGGLSRTEVIAYPDRILGTDQTRRFLECLERRKKREPFHYITGEKEFFGLSFHVDDRVLIPRPETELLVEIGLKRLHEIDRPVFCEVGIGSGCVSISILKSIEDAEAIGVDISISALEVAAINSRRHGVENRLKLVSSDLLTAVEGNGSFDAILSNPPYIAATEMEDLQPEVRDFEPRHALTDESSGLTLIGRIVAESERLLVDSGLLAIEIGHDQREAVETMFGDDHWTSRGFLKDLQGHERIVFATRRPRKASN
jgi:release factor glutamine methyltransferase